MNISDYDKLACSWLSAINYMRDGGFSLVADRACKLDRGDLLCRDDDGKWTLSHIQVNDMLSREWYKLVPKKKPDRFAEVDALIEKYQDDMTRQGNIDFCTKFARAIVEIIEKGKA